MNDEVVDGLRQRYWSLVVTACEWRAYDVDVPEVMAERVFTSLGTGKDRDVRDLFRAVDKIVAQAYRKKVSQRSSLDAMRGMATMRQDLTLPVPLVALSSLREGDRRILQHAYWDELDPVEIATVLATGVENVSRRLENATLRLTERAAKKGVQVHDVRSLLAEIKPGIHHRYESSPGA